MLKIKEQNDVAVSITLDDSGHIRLYYDHIAVGVLSPGTGSIMLTVLWEEDKDYLRDKGICLDNDGFLRTIKMYKVTK